MHAIYAGREMNAFHVIYIQKRVGERDRAHAEYEVKKERMHEEVNG